MIKIRTAILIAFFICNSLVQLYAQPENAAFRNLTPADGLPTTRLSDISQDSFGLIWIGSFDEVYRFDGTTYKTIYSGDVRFLCPDNHGGMWISIAGGQVAYYNSYTDSLSNYDIPPKDRLKRMEINKYGDVIYDRFTHIQTNDYGDVWGATTEGVVKYDPVTNKFILEKGQKKGAIIYPQSVGNHGLYFVHVQGEGQPYLIGHRDLKGQYSYEPFPIDLNNSQKGKLFFEESRINLLAWDSTGILLVNRFGWAYKKPVTSNWVFKKPLSGGNELFFRTGIIDENEKLWLNAYNSITRIDIKTARIFSYRHSKENFNSILSSIPYSPPAHIYINRQGILWIPCFSFTGK